MFGRKLADGCVEGGCYFCAQGLLIRRRCRVKNQRLVRQWLCVTALLLPKLIETLIGGDAQQPAAEDTAAKAFDRSVGSEKCLLGGIFRCLRIANHAQAEVVHGALMALDQLIESAYVTALGRRREDIVGG